MKRFLHWRATSLMMPIILFLLLATVPVNAQIPPVIESLEPNQGFQGATLDVNIYGQYFEKSATVSFSNLLIYVNQVDYQSEILIVANITIDPYAPVGLCSITVENSPGLADTLPDSFEVLDALFPNLDSMLPNNGYQGDMGIVATVSGTELPDGGVFSFLQSGGPEVVNSVYVNAQTYQITINIPETASLGWYDLVGDFPGQVQAILEGAFEVLEKPLPQLISLLPDNAYQGDTNVSVTLSGENMVSSGQFVFLPAGGPEITNAAFINAQTYQLTLNVPGDATPGMYDLGATFPGIPQIVLDSAFEVLEKPLPQLISLLPDNAYQGDTNVLVTLSGENMLSSGQFSFQPAGGPEVTNAAFVNAQTYQLTLNIPQDATPGMYDLGGTFPGIPQIVLDSAFEVLEKPLPQLTSLFPDNAYQGETNISVTLSGVNMPAAGQFSFLPAGGPDIANATYISPQTYQLTLNIPEDAAPGMYDLAADFPGIPQVVLPGAFEVLEFIVEYNLYLEGNPVVTGYSGQQGQTDFLVGIDSNKPNPVAGPFYLYASEAKDEASGEVIGLSNIDLLPTMTPSLTPGIYQMAVLRVAIPPGLPSGEYEGIITFDAPNLDIQEATRYTIAVQESAEEILYPELSRQELEVDLIAPGSSEAADAEEIVENTPLFEWSSSARFFDFHLFDVTGADEITGAVNFTRPAYEERDLSDMRLYYPLGAEPLVAGHTYAWYVEAKDIPGYDARISGREPEVIQSEVFYFKFIDVTAAGGEPEVLSIKVEPEYVDAEVEKEYEFSAILELAGPGFADVTWHVIPGSAAVVIGRNEYAYVTPISEGYFSVIAEAGGQSAYAVMRVGGMGAQASIDTSPEAVAKLQGRIDTVAKAIDEFKPLAASAVGLTIADTEANLAFERLTWESNDILKKAYELIEPYMLTGKASLTKPSAGSWFLVEPFPGHLGFFTNDKSSFESFVSRNIMAFSELQKDLDRVADESAKAEAKHNEVLATSENANEIATNAMANIVHESDELNADLGNIRDSLEVEISPFCSRASMAGRLMSRR